MRLSTLCAAFLAILYCTATPVFAEAKIGVVVINELLKGYEKFDDYQKQIDQRGREWDAKLTKARQELDAIALEIKNLTDGSAERKRLITAYDQKNQTLQVAEFQAKMELAALDEQLSGEVYDDIAQAIQDYAKLEGYQLIFKNDPIKREGKNAQELDQELKMASVLYCDPSLNITPKVLEMLNERYRRAKAAKEKEK